MPDILVEKTTGKTFVSKAVWYALLLTEYYDACWLHFSESCCSIQSLKGFLCR